MRVISVKTLKLFWEKHPDAESPLRSWYTEAKKGRWKGPQDIKTEYRTASILRNNRVVFNIKGNTYRLVVAVKYEFQIVYIRFIGTHAAYDEIKAEEI
jgi:mRNA interferase HigB